MTRRVWWRRSIQLDEPYLVTDLERAHRLVRQAVDRLGSDRVWVAPSCSLLHVPVDLDRETSLDAELRSWLAFATQKLGEIRALADASPSDAPPVNVAFAASRDAVATRRKSARVHDSEVTARLAAVDGTMTRRRSPFSARIDTQIHTHMCYAEFGAIFEAITALDADVLSIETSRSHMELFVDFRRVQYPNQVGPGVYDIHSPRVPSVEEMVVLLHRALAVVPAAQLWVNPDCGLKTRHWPEVEAALARMVAAARRVRAEVVP